MNKQHIFIAFFLFFFVFLASYILFFRSNALNTDNGVSVKTDIEPIILHFGDVYIVYDSTKRDPENVHWTPYDEDFIQENANQYLTRLADLPQCQGTQIGNQYIIPLHDHPIYNYVLFSMGREDLDKNVHQKLEELKTGECGYIEVTQENEQKIGELFAIYKSIYEVSDMAMIESHREHLYDYLVAQQNVIEHTDEIFAFVLYIPHFNKDGNSDKELAWQYEDETVIIRIKDNTGEIHDAWTIHVRDANSIREVRALLQSVYGRGCDVVEGFRDMKNTYNMNMIVTDARNCRFNENLAIKFDPQAKKLAYWDMGDRDYFTIYDNASGKQIRLDTFMENTFYFLPVLTPIYFE